MKTLNTEQAEALLQRWAESMRSGSSDQGLPAEASVFITSWIKDENELISADEQDELVRANAAVDSLSMPHLRMIYKRHRLGWLVWDFCDEEALYAAAMAEFVIKFSRK